MLNIYRQEALELDLLSHLWYANEACDMARTRGVGLAQNWVRLAQIVKKQLLCKISVSTFCLTEQQYNN